MFSQPENIKLAYLKLTRLWMLCDVSRRHLTRCLHVRNKKQRVMECSIEDEWQHHHKFVLPKLVYQVAWELEHIVSVKLHILVFRNLLHQWVCGSSGFHENFSEIPQSFINTKAVYYPTLSLSCIRIKKYRMLVSMVGPI